MPVLLATDPNTDMGRIAQENGFGMWSLSGDIDKFMANMDELSSNNDRTTAMGSIGQRYLIDNYSIEKPADIIIKSL